MIWRLLEEAGVDDKAAPKGGAIAAKEEENSRH